jgi:hypothetical protein
MSVFGKEEGISSFTLLGMAVKPHTLESIGLVDMVFYMIYDAVSPMWWMDGTKKGQDVGKRSDKIGGAPLFFQNKGD